MIIPLHRIVTFIFCFSLALLCSYTANATHVIGTEISYKCFGDGNYEFTVKVFRDCNPGNAQFDYPAQFIFFDGDGNIINELTQNIYPSDSAYVTYTSSNPCIIMPPNACVQEATYTFSMSLPPRSGGYIMSYQRCCRNESILNIVSPLNTGSTNFVVIDDSIYAACNNSPVYNNYPPIVICNSEPLIFDHSAVDEDGDSLVYELCGPYNSPAPTDPSPIETPPFKSITYKPGYSATNPMKGSSPLAIDPVTGLMTVTPDVKGRFVVGVCISEYRKGKLLGHYLRDFQFIVVDCKKTVVASIPDEVGMCDSSTIIHFRNHSTGGNIYKWDFGVTGTTSDTSTETNPVYTFPKPGVYDVTLFVYKTGSECGDTATGTVTIYPPLKAYKDTAIILGTTGKVWATGGTTYHWSPSNSVEDSAAAETVVTPTVTTTYTVTTLLPNNCPDTQMVVVTVLKDPIVKSPDAFTPNGDGKNDYFRLKYIGTSSLIQDVDFRIYNRWGQLVFQSNDPLTRGWDGTLNGKPQPVGVYVYYFSGVSTELGTPFRFKGNVTLLR